jgi:predicted Zn-dependent protease with MMP-like domain
MDFPRRVVMAQEVVAGVHRRLPPEVREAAVSVPVCYEPQPNPALLADGCEPDLLGLFVGHEHSDDLPLPPQILLFLDNLWDYADEDEAVFRDEVRLTYLHELGHYLGWDEDEIAARGLE